jgi:hypothetical protein
MKIHYKHPVGGGTHEGPSGTVYDFQEDDSGRRVADVENKQDIERFLSIKDAAGQPLFVSLRKRKAKADPDLNETGADSENESDDEDQGDEVGTQSVGLSDSADTGDVVELEAGLNEPEAPEETMSVLGLNEPGTSLDSAELN